MKRLFFCLLLAGCNAPLDAGGNGMAAGDDDPLNVDAPAPAGSLDELYRKVIYPSCASQPGACHSGQFEPNLSTPALAYANLVLRPGLEHEDELRVKPGDPDKSLIIDKLRKRNVATQMPLGAKPLPDELITLFEDWVRNGALRTPGDAPAPILNNPPEAPEVALFDGPGAGAHRLDGNGPLKVQAGDTLVLRHSVHDFETAPPDMAYAGFILYTADGNAVMLGSDTFAQATYDPAAPLGQKRPLSYRYTWTVPATLDVQDYMTGMVKQVNASGASLTVIAYYADTGGADGISTYTIANDLIGVK
jgi:hypothetical protein